MILKKNSRVFAGGMLLLCGLSVHGSVTKPGPGATFDETEIRILLVVDPNVDSADVTDAVDFLMGSWQNTGLHEGAGDGTSLVIAHTLTASSSTFVGTVQQQYEKVRAFAEELVPPLAIDRRDTYGADIVMGLSDGATNGCGWAPQENWQGLFADFDPDQNTGGLDLDGRNSSYVGLAVVTQNAQKCDHWTLAHEFGHLLGGGHYSIPLTKALYFDSNATYQLLWMGGFRRVTALANVWGTDACPSAPSAGHCWRQEQYSDGQYGTPDPDDHNNARALRTTSRSVANYRTGTGLPAALPACTDGQDNDGDSFVDGADPECSVCSAEFCPPSPPAPPPGCDGTAQPTNFYAEVRQVCVPGSSYTGWRVSWSHSCPAQVTEYRVYAQQPPSVPPVYRWSVASRYIDLRVLNAPARISVQACGPVGCGSLSSGAAIIDDIC